MFLSTRRCLFALSRAVLLCGLSLLWCGADSGGETMHFDIAAADAGVALKQFAQVSGVRMLYASDMIWGVTTKPVRGEISPYLALRTMLEGTGLVVKKGKGNGVFLVARETTSATGPTFPMNPSPNVDSSSRPASPGRLSLVLLALFGVGESSAQSSTPSLASAESEVLQLSPFEVATSANVGYGAQFSNSSSRMNLRYIDVPQTVNVVTSEFLDDANLFDSRDAVKYVNNVVARTNAHQVETFFIRGLQTSNSYVDGFLVSFPTSRDSGLIDRIEYVKGPASAAIGRGEAAGLVNYVSKSPQNSRSDSYSLTVGTDSFYRARFDHNGVLRKGMAYRIPVYFEDGDNARGGVGGKLMHIKKYGIGPSYRWQISPKTDLVLRSGFYRYEGPGAIGGTNWSDKDVYRARLATNLNSQWTLFTDPFVDPRTVNGFNNGGRETDNAEASAVLVHQFNDVISFRGGARWEDMSERFIQQNINLSVVRNPADPKDYLVSMTMQDTIRSGDALRGQGDLLFDKTIGSSKHQLLLGYDQFENSGTSKSGSRGGLTQSMYRPSPEGPAGFDPRTWVTTYTSDSDTKNKGHAYYGQYSGSFLNNKFQVMAGWREDITSSTFFNRRTNLGSAGPEQKTHVPRYSITYKPVDFMSLYYVHSEQADPSVTRFRFDGFTTANGATQWDANDPRRNETLTSAVTAELDEIGVKANLLNDRVTLSAALFSLDRVGLIQNVLTNGPGANGIGTLTYNRWFTIPGESVRGFEVEVFGQPVPRLTVIASYGGMSGSTTDATGARAAIPGLISSAAIFTKYSFRNQDNEGFQFTWGAKLYFKGWLVLGGAPTTYSRDQYIIDAGGSYHFRKGKYSIALTANNVTDEFVLINNNAQLAFRRVFLTFTGKF